MANKKTTKKNAVAVVETTTETTAVAGVEPTETFEAAPETPATSAVNPREATLSFIDNVISQVEVVLSEMADGAKVPMIGRAADNTRPGTVGMCDLVASAVGGGLDAQDVYPMVRLYLSHRAGVQVARGRDGGIFKGGRPEREKVTPAQRLAARRAEVEAREAALNAREAALNTTATAEA